MKTTYTLCVRKWFRQGSSYFTMRVVTPTGEQLFAPYQYGHGYATAIHEAKRLLAEAGTPAPEGAYFMVDEVNVSRKADMHNGGLKS
jgi:hypothetical protein